MPCRSICLVGEIDYDANLRILYYDLAGAHSPEVIRMLLSITTPDHLLYGSDFPYAAPQVLTQSLSRMKQYLASEPDLAPFKDMILRKNAQWLFGQTKEKPAAELTSANMIVRIAEIEVYPQYLKEYLTFANEVDRLSIEREPGVICLYPMQSADDSTKIRILEIYASEEAYQQHLKTDHFLKYKQGTLHMVKDLKLPTMKPLDPETMKLIFKKTTLVTNTHLFGDIFASDQLSAWLCDKGYTLSTKWPKGEPNPYGKYFIGQSYLADVGGGVMNVTFEPRCRNNWHIHHKQVQVLICVAGRGWYQEWGKTPVEMTPGTVIAIPAEVKHWHGAQKDSWFQHLTYHKDVQEDASNEWCEPVTDEVYDKVAENCTNRN